MNQTSGEHADRIYQATHSCDGFLFRLQEFAETSELDDPAQGILLSDIAEIRNRRSRSGPNPFARSLLTIGRRRGRSARVHSPRPSNMFGVRTMLLRRPTQRTSRHAVR